MVLTRWAFAACLALAASSALAAVPTLPPERLQAGQKAVVKTVFEGSRIEEFEAEIVGVLKGGRAAGDLILARATTERVVKSGIAQGMSGSPVYVDGKLVGALSSAWTFSREPLFGVTPIGEMLQVLEVAPAASGGGGGSVGPTGLEPSPRSLAFGELRWPEPPGAPAAPPEPNGAAASALAAAPRPLPIPVACAGLDAGALSFTRTLLEPLGFTAVPGGTAADAPAASSLEPGSAVAVELLRGDLQLSAIGTVTWREGDRVLIFGHPFFQSGHVKMPLASATITTIVASDLISFKLGASGRPLGVATQDRRAAVAGTLGGAPRLMPLSVVVHGDGPRPQTFRFESIEDRSLAPQLVAIAALNSLLESGGMGSGQTVRWRLDLYRRGKAPLALRDLVAGGSVASELVRTLSSPLQFLYNNPYETFALDSLSVRLDIEPGLDLWTLRGVQVLDAAVRPGRSLRVRCEVERWRGDRQPVDLTLDVPEELPAGRYVLWVGGGAELSRYEAQRLPGRYRPTSLDDAWRRIADLRTSERLYAALLARAPEVTRRGYDYPELPISALGILVSGQQAEEGTRPGMQAILDETRRDFGGQVRGEVQLEVTVDPQAP